MSKEIVMVMMGKGLHHWRDDNGNGDEYCLIKRYHPDGEWEDEMGNYFATYRRTRDGKIFKDISTRNLDLHMTYMMELEEVV